MNAIVTGNPYKYWIDGGENMVVHFLNYRGDDYDGYESYLKNTLGGIRIEPNDFSILYTYVNLALDILFTCGDGSVEFSFFTDEVDEYEWLSKICPDGCDMKTFWLHGNQWATVIYTPTKKISPSDLVELMFELYDTEPFEYWAWDAETNFESVNTGYVLSIDEVLEAF